MATSTLRGRWNHAGSQDSALMAAPSLADLAVHSQRPDDERSGAQPRGGLPRNGWALRGHARPCSQRQGCSKGADERCHHELPCPTSGHDTATGHDASTQIQTEDPRRPAARPAHRPVRSGLVRHAGAGGSGRGHRRHLRPRISGSGRRSSFRGAAVVPPAADGRPRRERLVSTLAERGRVGGLDVVPPLSRRSG